MLPEMTAGFRQVSLLLLAVLSLEACRASAPPVAMAPAPVPVSPVPVRFLLTFDDGPSAAAVNNTTALILDTLANNRWQPNIKAIFFVQTRHRSGGGSEIGQQLLQRMHAEGHVLALHTASPRGHVSHVRMPQAELEQSLADGIGDIRAITGQAPLFIRPPFWAHNSETVELYESRGLTMLLDDIIIRDGKSRGITANPRARLRIRADLRHAAQRIQDNEIPALSGYIPLVMTMHDTNPTTARDLELYLTMLIEEARAAGLEVAAQPFISPTAEVAKVAGLRASRALLARGEGVSSYR